MARFSDEDVRRAILAPQKFRIVDFPGMEGVEVAVRCLSGMETQRCRIEAVDDMIRLAKLRGETPETLVDLDPILQEQVVHRAVIAAAFFDSETIEDDTPKPFFSHKDEVLTMSTTQAMDLINLYNENHEMSNMFSSMSESDLGVLAEAIKKSPENLGLTSHLRRGTLLRLLNFTAQKMA